MSHDGRPWGVAGQRASEWCMSLQASEAIKNTCGISVCVVTGDVFGVVEDSHGTPSFQRCHCGRCDGDPPPTDERAALPEPRGDYPVAVELCYCCAAELIPSGTRWSSFYCDECRARVRELNECCGVVVIPVGRHSIMNSVSLPPTEANERTLSRLAKRLSGLFERIDVLIRWRRELVARYASTADSKAPWLSLDAYLSCARKHGKERALNELSTRFGVPRSRARRAER